ncbi:MAG: lysylphosphatidylglycerol synthase transmembrane domain-containing protein [Polyangia bacterium]|nr:lysylphosphatidylglycerol synthase transmembrane domain-containing protein [Polyangia bacterium]
MNRLLLRLILGLLLGVVVWVGFAIYADIQALTEHLGSFAWWRIGPVIGLTLLAYGLRFIKWQYLLGQAQARVPMGRSALVYLAGFSMAITPGKVGELLKAWLLKSTDNIPITRTAPVVIADRLTDLVALVLLCLLGAFTYVEDPRFGALLIFCGLIVLGMTSLFASPRAFTWGIHLVARLPLGRRIAPRLAELGEPLHLLLRPIPLLATSLFSAVAWLGECLGFYLVLEGLPGVDSPLPLAIFIYSATTVLGALSFLPGGLGVTEGSMTLLLLRSASGLGRSGAVAATVLIRLCTLWFGVVLGFAALGIIRLRSGVGLPPKSAPDTDDQQ